MKKTMFLLAFICIAIAICLTSCGKSKNDENGGHTHSFVLENASESTKKSDATCTTKAVYYKSCSCGELGTETFEYGDFDAHNFNLQSTDAKYFAAEADCFSPTLYYYSCECGERGYETFEVGEANGHSFVGYVCEDCGSEKSSEGLIFQLNENHNHYALVGYDENVTENVYISTYNGMPVFSIDFEAFKDCTTIKNVYLSTQVRSIADNAFWGCTNLESIYLGNVVSFGTGVFAYCTSLESITSSGEVTALKIINNCVITDTTINYEDGSYETVNIILAGCNNSIIPQDQDIVLIAINAFRGLPGFTYAVLPETIREIGPYAFQDCTGLKELTLNNGIQILGDLCFLNCTSLEKIYYNVPDLKIYGGYEFKGVGKSSDGLTLTVGKDVKSIPADLFSSDEILGACDITSLVFEEECMIERIGLRAFMGTAITSLNLPNTVTFIDEFAFADCTALTSVKMSSGVTVINNHCFEGCESLTDLTLYSNITKIGECAFAYCSSLKSITIPTSTTTIGAQAFESCLSLTTVSIGKNVTEINYRAFANCPVLSNVFYNAENVADFYDVTPTNVFAESGSESRGINLTVGPNVKRIPAYMFYGTKNLLTITFDEDNACTVLGEHAFSYSKKLTSVTIPAEITEFKSAFDDCTALAEVYNLSSVELVPNVTATGIEEFLFYVHTSADEASKMVYINDYVFFVDGATRVLVGYIGNDKVLTLPENCNGYTYKINSLAFYAHDLEEVVISSGVSEIGSEVFRNSGVQKITIMNGVTKIGSSAFSGCVLDEIIIPTSVAFIDMNAFSGVANIYCEVESKPEGWNEYYLWSGVGVDNTVYWYSANEPTSEGNYWRYVDGVATPW